MKVLVLNSAEVRTCLPPDDLRGAMENALKALSSKDAQNFPRFVFPFGKSSAVCFMPATNDGNGLLGFKVVSLFPANSERSLNPHQGIVTLLDENTGQIKSIMEGCEITAVRTAAVSAVATEHLSRVDSRNLAILGAGLQAHEHALAICRVRPVQQVKIFNRSRARAIQMADALGKLIQASISIAETPQEAVRDADIVATCTPSKQPFLKIGDFKSGAHINAMGASLPGFSETKLQDDPRLKIYLDCYENCSLEADEVFEPIKQGTLSKSHIAGDLGEVLLGKVDGRKSPGEITFFKSVGLGVEDLYAADLAYRNALQKGLGNFIDF